jgi:hypothetical protein
MSRQVDQRKALPVLTVRHRPWVLGFDVNREPQPVEHKQPRHVSVDPGPIEPCLRRNRAHPVLDETVMLSDRIHRGGPGA